MKIYRQWKRKQFNKGAQFVIEQFLKDMQRLYINNKERPLEYEVYKSTVKAYWISKLSNIKNEIGPL